MEKLEKLAESVGWEPKTQTKTKLLWTYILYFFNKLYFFSYNSALNIDLSITNTVLFALFECISDACFFIGNKSRVADLLL